MYRRGYPIHKFGTKPIRSAVVRTQPESVHWKANWDVTHRPQRQQGGLRWEIFAQKDITIQPGEIKMLRLGLAVRMWWGVCLVSLRQNLKEKGCVLQDGVVSENVGDTVINIRNDADSLVTINEGESLCYVNYEDGKRFDLRVPQTIKHIPYKQQGGRRWEIFAQEETTIRPGETKTLNLGLGVETISGTCLVSLRQNLKEAGCTVRDGTVTGNVEDIAIDIRNNSDSPVTILEGDSLCFIHYTVDSF